MENNETTFENILDSINSLEIINLFDIPEIELYMDQVTTFIDDKLKDYKRNQNDKILTKTMINNYTKDKLLPPPNKKKYSKSHMILLILIYHLKSVLSITDIRDLFNSVDINTINTDEKKETIEKIYNEFIEYQKGQTNIFLNELNLNQNINIEDKISLISLVIMLVIQAESQKMLAEKIIDNFLKKDEKKVK